MSFSEWKENVRKNNLVKVISKELSIPASESLNLYDVLENSVEDYAWTVVDTIVKKYGVYTKIVSLSDSRIFTDEQRKIVDFNKRNIAFARQNLDVFLNKHYNFNHLKDVLMNTDGIKEGFLFAELYLNGVSNKDTYVFLSKLSEEIKNDPVYVMLDKRYFPKFMPLSFPNILKP